MDHINATFPAGYTSPTPLAQEDDKYLWVIDGYKIWAKTYEEAIELASIIAGF
jgi:hypothetical protein